MFFFGDSITGAYEDADAYPDTVKNRLGIHGINVGFSGCRMSTDNTLALRDPFSMVQLATSIISKDWTSQDANTSVNERFPARLTTLKTIDFSTIDIVTIFYSTNDFASSIAIDNANNNLDITTLLGATRYSIKKLFENYPLLKIILIGTAWRTVPNGNPPEEDTNSAGIYVSQYVEGLRSVANEFHIPFIDMYDGLGIE